MNKIKLLISLLIIVAISILYGLIMILINHKIDYISWYSGIIFFGIGILLGRWVFSDKE